MPTGCPGTRPLPRCPSGGARSCARANAQTDHAELTAPSKRRSRTLSGGVGAATGQSEISRVCCPDAAAGPSGTVVVNAVVEVSCEGIRLRNGFPGRVPTMGLLRIIDVARLLIPGSRYAPLTTAPHAHSERRSTRALEGAHDARPSVSPALTSRALTTVPRRTAAGPMSLDRERIMPDLGWARHPRRCLTRH